MIDSERCGKEQQRGRVLLVGSRQRHTLGNVEEAVVIMSYIGSIFAVMYLKLVMSGS